MYNTYVSKIIPPAITHLDWYTLIVIYHQRRIWARQESHVDRIKYLLLRKKMNSEDIVGKDCQRLGTGRVINWIRYRVFRPRISPRTSPRAILTFSRTLSRRCSELSERTARRVTITFRRVSLNHATVHRSRRELQHHRVQSHRVHNAWEIDRKRGRMRAFNSVNAYEIRNW